MLVEDGVSKIKRPHLIEIPLLVGTLQPYETLQMCYLGPLYSSSDVDGYPPEYLIIDVSH